MQNDLKDTQNNQKVIKMTKMIKEWPQRHAKQPNSDVKWLQSDTKSLILHYVGTVWSV